MYEQEVSMKLIRFGEANIEKPGVLLASGERIDVSDYIEDYNEEFFETEGIQRLDTWLKRNQDTAPRFSRGVRLGPPVARPSKIICVGLNYSDHAAESGMEVPKEPVLFSKASTALCGPDDEIEIPRHSVKTDWEVELAFVIRQKAKYVDEKDAESYIAGYAIMNDVSEREFQAERCGQWVKGKSHDTFAPMGPFLATPDELSDVLNLTMTLKVNGTCMQSGNTNTMIYKPLFLVHYISQFMTLLPGDIISTGTPPGVGFGMKPPTYLKEDDIIELRIDGLGQQRQQVVNA